MTTSITIYHRTGRDAFMQASQVFKLGGKVTFELAYTYEAAAADLDAVDGSEVNVKLEKRSLSVGDVIGIGEINASTGKNLFEVQNVGFHPIVDVRVKMALIHASRGVAALNKGSFEQWMKRVDRAVQTVGLSVYDLADQPYRDWYEAGHTAAGSARRALKADGL